MGLPKSFIDKYRDLVDNSTLYGVRITDLTEDELQIACVAGWELLKKEQLKVRKL
jgi:hypothetical protein